MSEGESPGRTPPFGHENGKSARRHGVWRLYDAIPLDECIQKPPPGPIDWSC